jgi:hypothetical protein
MQIGTKFTAIDKLGSKYDYELIALDSSNPMREYILNNETNGILTEVEQEWFNQRKIILH